MKKTVASSVLWVLFFSLLCISTACKKEKKEYVVSLELKEVISSLTSTRYPRLINLNNGHLIFLGKGQIFHSSDNGDNWSASSLPGTTSYYYENYSIGSNDTLYVAGHQLAAGTAGILMYSTNYGQSFSQYLPTQTSLEFYKYFRFKTNRIFQLNISGSPQLKRSNNRGISWSNIIPAGVSSIDGIYFFNQDTGVIYDYWNGTFRTQNGGNSWTKIINSSPPILYGFEFKNDLIGYGISYQGKAYLSTNGGINWNNLTYPPYYTWDIDNNDQVCGFKGGGAGFEYINSYNNTSSSEFDEHFSYYENGVLKNVMVNPDGGKLKSNAKHIFNLGNGLFFCIDSQTNSLKKLVIK